MKLIIAYLQPEKLSAVKAELQKAEIGRLSATNALGCGSQLGYEETYRGAKEEINLLKKKERIRIKKYMEKNVFMIKLFN